MKINMRKLSKFKRREFQKIAAEIGRLAKKKKRLKRSTNGARGQEKTRLLR